MHPLLVKLGVKYDQSLVAESLQKPVFTQAKFPAELPYTPTTRIFVLGNSTGKDAFNSNSREGGGCDRDLSSMAQSSAKEKETFRRCMSVLQRRTPPKDRYNEGLSLYDPEAHGALFASLKALVG